MNDSFKAEEFKLDNKSTIKKMLYGMPRLGTSLLIGVEAFSLFSLYYLGFGLNPLLIGIALAAGYIGIAVGQFLLGWISDLKYTRIGRRKPYIIIFAPLLGISFIFLFLPNLFLPNITDQFLLFMWLLIWDIIFRFSYAVTTPYQAWMAEIFEIGERPEVSQYQNIFNYYGTGLMGIFTFFILTEYLENIAAKSGYISCDFAIYIIIFGAISWILFYILMIFMPTEPHYSINSDLNENLKTVIKNRNFLAAVCMHGISGVAWAIISSVMLIYTEVVLGLDGIDYLVIGGFLVLGVFLFLYYWRKRIEKKGKKRNILSVFGFSIVFLPITLLGIFPIIPSLFLGILFIFGIGIILGGWNLFPYIMYADLAEDDENQTGQLKAGIYTGFPFLILNFCQSAGIFILGVIMSFPDLFLLGFSVGLVIWGPICSVILFFCYIYTKKYVILDFDWEKKK